jgi:two-component system CheB/CheR fusion protein
VLARWAADLLVRVQTEKDLRDSEARQKVLVAELQHRTRNIISVVQSIAERSAEDVSSVGDFLARYSRRLSALARVQSLLSHSDAEPITIGALVRMELDAVGFSGKSDRVRLSGPEVRLRNTIVQTLALALHELTTNALKHGSLGRDKGTLDVLWQVREDPHRHLLLEWRERGLQLSPQQQVFAHRGQGVELIEEALPYTLGAQTSLKLEESGVVCVIDMPLDKTQKGSGATAQIRSVA